MYPCDIIFPSNLHIQSFILLLRGESFNEVDEDKLNISETMDYRNSRESYGTCISHDRNERQTLEHAESCRRIENSCVPDDRPVEDALKVLKPETKTPQSVNTTVMADALLSLNAMTVKHAGNVEEQRRYLKEWISNSKIVSKGAIITSFYRVNINQSMHRF